MQPHPQPKASTSAQQAPALMALNSQEAGTNQARAKSISTEAAETAPNKRRRFDSKPDPAAIATPLIDDDIDWAASSGACEHPLADSDATDAQAQQDLTLPQQESEQLQARGFAQEAAAEDAAAAEAASEAYHQPDLVSDYQAGSQGNSDKGLVQHAVAEYVRALLDPFYKAGIVDREVSVAEPIRVATSQCMLQHRPEECKSACICLQAPHWCHHLKALLDVWLMLFPIPKRLFLIQKCHLYTGNLNSERSGDSKMRFYIMEMF